MRPSGFALWIAATLPLGCVEVALDNPLRYGEVPPSERVPIPCYYAIDPVTDAIVVEDLNYQARLGPALAGQLQAALGGLCRGTGRVKNRNEFIALAGGEPGLLVEVHATAEMNARMWTWAVNTGSVRGRALVRGPADGPLRPYEFAGDGKKRQYYAEVGSGAEGLRHALGDAVQNLVDQLRQDRPSLEALASETGASEP
jgi:hypothetical protein